MELKKEGVRVLGYVNVHFLRGGTLYKAALEKDFLVKNPQGETYIIDFGEYYCATVDLSNPAAFEWYKGRHNYSWYVSQVCTNFYDGDRLIY